MSNLILLKKGEVMKGDDNNIKSKRAHAQNNAREMRMQRLEGKY